VRNLYTNHGLVLIRIWVDPDATLSEIAGDIGVKERAVYLIVRDLVEAGFIEKQKVGRRNQYHVNIEYALDYQPIPHTTIREQIVGLALTMGMRLPDAAPAPRSRARKEGERAAAASR
jgi:transcription initiation factor IIE alpha subunit